MIKLYWCSGMRINMEMNWIIEDILMCRFSNDSKKRSQYLEGMKKNYSLHYG